jgi:hypothetical protein
LSRNFQMPKLNGVNFQLAHKCLKRWL